MSCVTSAAMLSFGPDETAPLTASAACSSTALHLWARCRLVCCTGGRPAVSSHSARGSSNDAGYDIFA